MLKEMREARKAAAEKEGVQLEEEEEEESEEEDEEVRPKLVDEKRLPPLKKGPDGKALANPKLVYNVVAVLCVLFLPSFCRFDKWLIFSRLQFRLRLHITHLRPHFLLLPHCAIDGAHCCYPSPRTALAVPR